jgi:hypothetical protein
MKFSPSGAVDGDPDDATARDGRGRRQRRPLPAGTGAAIPGHIEAENYNNGGEGVAYHDTTPANEGGEYRHDAVDIEKATGEGSYVVGWVRPGEWLKYTVNVAEAGVYDVSFRVSSNRADGSFKMQVDGHRRLHGHGPEHGELPDLSDGRAAGLAPGRLPRRSGSTSTATRT